MHVLFFIAAVLSAIGIATAMTLRNPIHCILSLAIGLVGIAGLYIALAAQFVGFTQVMVYIGAVAILAVFALMMTQNGTIEIRNSEGWFGRIAGITIPLAVFGVITYAVTRITPTRSTSNQIPTETAKQIGVVLLHEFSVPLEVLGILLTAALIGAVIVAIPDALEKP